MTANADRIRERVRKFGYETHASICASPRGKRNVCGRCDKEERRTFTKSETLKLKNPFTGNICTHCGYCSECVTPGGPISQAGRV